MAQFQPVKKIGTLPIERIRPQDLAAAELKAMTVVGNASKNHFIEGFQQGGGKTDASQGGWDARKDPTGGGGRGVLIGHGTGTLWRDIDVRRVSAKGVTIGVWRIPYAATHNEGLEVPERRATKKKALKFSVEGKTVFAKRAKAFTMPQREFMGPSKELTNDNLKLVAKVMGKPFKPHL